MNFIRILDIRKQIDFGTKHYALEIKSSQTIQEKYFDGLKYWMKISGTDPAALFLVYAGQESYVRNRMNVVGWKYIRDKIVFPAL